MLAPMPVISVSHRNRWFRLPQSWSKNRRGKYARVPLLVAVLLLLTLIPFVLFRGSQVPEAEAAWWDNSWRYRKSIQVTNNTTEQTNVYITLTLDTSDTTKFQDDCGDLRFTKQNGQVLPYYIVSDCGTASTSVHVQLDTFPSGEQAIFVYYGNLSAPNGSASNDFLMEATNYIVGGTGSEETAPGPVAYWKFDEGSGSTAFDSANYGLGDELLADGDMEAPDTSAWIAVNNAIVSKEITPQHRGNPGQVLRVAYNGTSNPYTRQYILQAGKTYRVTGYLRSDGTATPRIEMQSSNIFVGTTSSDWQYFDETIISDGSSFNLRALGSSGYAEFDDVSVREIIFGNHGTITGATWAGEDQCVSGKCLGFDGSDDHIRMGTGPSLDGSVNFTLGAWMKSGSSTQQRLVQQRDKTGYNGTFWLEITTIGKVAFVVRGTDADYQCSSDFSSSTSVNDNKWHYISAVRDGPSLYLYVDGKQENTCLGTLKHLDNSIGIALGRDIRDNKFNFNGLMDEVKIFPYALSENEIKAEYNLGAAAVIGTGPAAPPPAGGNLDDSLVAHWAFDEQAGQTAHDRVGGNDGSLGADTNPGTDDPTWKTASECKVNGCLGFDRDERNYISSIKDLTISGDFSYSAWVMTDNPRIGHQGIVSNHYHSSPCYGVSLTIYSNGRFGVAAGDGEDNRPSSYFGPAVSPNSWYHVVVAYEDGTFSFYINGEKLSDTWTTPVAQDNSDFVLGRWASSYGDYNFNGLIDEVKIYNTALTPEQVLQDMNAGASLTVGVGADEADEIIDGAGAPPIAEWKFDENQGTTAYDTSGNGNDGVVNGASWKSGCQQGACLEFDGVDDYVGVGQPLSSFEDMTIEAWVKLFKDNTNQSVFYTCYGAGEAEYLGLFVEPNNQVRIDYDPGDDGGGRISSYSSTVINDNQWHHVVGIFEGGDRQSLYLDGILTDEDSLETSEATINPSCNWTIGKGTYNNWSGRIDHVKIYDYARTPAQIAYDYNRGAPVAHWRFDECEGTVAHDSSGNGNHGTINIGPSGSQSTAGTCQTSGAWANGKDGKFNGSLNFDGEDDDLSIDSHGSELNLTGDLSLAAWVRTSNSGKIYHGTASTWGHSLSIATSGRVASAFIQTNPSVVNESVASNQIINDGQWHHVVVTRQNGVAMKVYVDGQLDNTVAASDLNLRTGIGRTIGSYNSSGFFNGQIDDMRIYNYALSPAQVRKVMNEGAALRFGP